MEFNATDWKRLERLRTHFINSSSKALGAYWQDEHDLELYHQSFAQRIGWKIEAVLRDLERRKMVLDPSSAILDWGCGSGIGSEVLLRYFEENQRKLPKIYLWDHSEVARNFALKKIKSQFSDADVELWDQKNSKNMTLFVSHVMNEWGDRDYLGFAELIDRFDEFLIVESGTRENSRVLGRLRDLLLNKKKNWSALAPCFHQNACPILKVENDWCHFFAKAPALVFQSAFWRDFSNKLKIDLRSLPFAYLCMSRERAQSSEAESVTIIGRPKIQKSKIDLLLCSSQSQRIEAYFTKRRHPALFKKIEKSSEWSSAKVHIERGEILELKD